VIFFIICLTLLITLLGIPSLIYFVILPEEKINILAYYLSAYGDSFWSALYVD
jgi:hypothetical protein